MDWLKLYIEFNHFELTSRDINAVLISINPAYSIFT